MLAFESGCVVGHESGLHARFVQPLRSKMPSDFQIVDRLYRDLADRRPLVEFDEDPGRLGALAFIE